MMGICSNVQLVIMRTHLSSQKHIHILLLKHMESSRWSLWLFKAKLDIGPDTGPPEGVQSWEYVPRPEPLSPPERWDRLPGGTALAQEGERDSLRASLPPLSTPSTQAVSVGANFLSLSSPRTAASGSNSAAAATGSGRASLLSTKVLRIKNGGVRYRVPPRTTPSQHPKGKVEGTWGRKQRS